MAQLSSNVLLDVFDAYIERRLAYEKAKVASFAGDVTNVPTSVPGAIDRAAFKKYLDEVNADVDARLADVLWGDNGKARTRSEVMAVFQQAETIYRSVRAEGLRTMSFNRRVAASIGRRHGHAVDNGLIKKNIVDPIEKNVLNGKR